MTFPPKRSLTPRTLAAVAVMVGLLVVPPSASLGLEPAAADPSPAALPLPGPSPAGACEATDPVPALLADAGAVAFTEEPTGGTWQTWNVHVGDVAVPPPPDVASPETADELGELLVIQVERTPADIEFAQNVDEGPAHKFWTEFYMNTIVEHASKTGKRNPPRLSREMAIVHTAIYDALVIAWDAKYCYQRPPPSTLLPALDPVVDVRPVPTYPSEHAVVAGVMGALLPRLFSWVTDEACYAPEPPPHPDDCEEDPALLESGVLKAAYSRLTAGTNYRSDVEAGLDLGRAVGEAVWAAREDDGANAPSTRTRITGTCNWQPTPPSFRQNPLEPQWGDVQPWIMATGSQFRVPPPPACDSQEYIAQYTQLYYTTGDAGANLNERQKEIARRWEGGQGTVTPPGISTWEASNITADEGLGTLRAARVMASIGVAVADAAIGVWDTKFAYWWDRPVTAIHRLAAAGVLPPEAADWDPFLTTPPFPGYVSGHSGFSAAAYFTLAHFFPERKHEFIAKSTEAAVSRYYGGIHFEADNERGIEVGMGIAGLLVARAGADGADA